MTVVGKMRLGSVDKRERSSATREVPPELRGRRVMTRLLGLAIELREAGAEPTTVHLSVDGETFLFDSAEETFSAPGAEAAAAGAATWRSFVARWMQERTRVTG